MLLLKKMPIIILWSIGKRVFISGTGFTGFVEDTGAEILKIFLIFLIFFPVEYPEIGCRTTFLLGLVVQKE